MKDFGHISLYDSIYLIITKVVANRLCEVIGELVGPFQFALIPGRFLTERKVVLNEIIMAWQR